MSGIIVDGVAYTPAQIRRLVQERHELVDQLRRLKARLSSNDTHLRQRTSALTRLIATRSVTLRTCSPSCLCSRGPSGSSESSSRPPEGGED